MTSEPGHRIRSLWIGTYPRPGADPGSGEGIFQVTVDAATGALSDARRVVALPSPSFLAVHPGGRSLYAVGETGVGSLTVLDLSGGDMPGSDIAGRGTVSSGGSDPCHVVATADRLWVTNYSDGVASTWPVDDDGALGAEAPVTYAHRGAGPVLERQEGPHAHFAHPVSRAAGTGEPSAETASDVVLVADLGTDELRAHRPGVPGDAGTSAVAATFPPGTGPRHLVELPGGALLVAGELDCRLHLLLPEPGPSDLPRYRHADSFPITEATWGPDAAPGFPSHLTLSPDGRHVHVGVRGPDVLAVLRLERAGDSGWTLVRTGDVALGAGAWPRHHAVVGDPGAGDVVAGDAAGAAADSAGGSAGNPAAELIVVAAQNSAELLSVRIDRATGKGEVTARLPFPVPPACVLEA
ncbi:lactonase family protein [Myceligenerans crystallogenes]|uniref:Lactonase family protein n=1 Tax=Myceligenerans crystallogenes TaxID=316335 RepID=A0ABP4ZJ28_9MICO